MNFQNLVVWLKRYKAIVSFCYYSSWLFALLIMFFGSTFVATAILWFLSFEKLSLLFVGMFLGSLVTGVISVVLYLRISFTKWLVHGYRWISAEYVYQIDANDKQRHTQTIKICIEAIRPNVDIFENRYLWSGRGNEDVQVLSPQHTLQGSVRRHQVWKYYYVHLGHGLAKGERTNITVCQQLYDEENLFESFLGKAVAEPIGHLTLRVLLPTRRPPTKVENIEQLGPPPIDRVAAKTVSSCDAATGECRWDISNPVLGRRYVIRWEY